MLERTSPPIDGKQIRDLLNVKYEIGFDSARNSAAFFDRKGFFQRAWLAYEAIESSRSCWRLNEKNAVCL